MPDPLLNIFLVEFTTYKGEYIAINVNTITHVIANGTTTRIYLIGKDKPIIVLGSLGQTIEEIEEMVAW